MYLKIFNFEDFSYEKDALNSKVILENGDSKIILFALKKNQILEKHKSPVDAAVFVLKGEIEFHDEQKSLNIKGGEMIIEHADSEHYVKAIKDSKFIVVRI